MQETPKTLLEETSELLDELTPVVQRNIETLQHDSNPLLQHLIQQEVERQEDLLQRIEAMKGRMHVYLNPPENVPQPDEPEGNLQREDSEPDEPENDSQQGTVYISVTGR